MAEKKKYDESAQLEQIGSRLQQHENTKPAAYESQWQQQIGDAMEKILSRKAFSYDLNEDAFYRTYSDAYHRQGQQAMVDAMGRAAAMTGGYGNSYAQTAGAQAYADRMDKLQDLIPELYSLALERYRLEGESLNDRLSLLQQQENQDYSRHQEGVSSWQQEQQRLADSYQDAYNRYRDGRDFAYRQERDKVADRQWQAEFDEAVRQFYEKLWS